MYYKDINKTQVYTYMTLVQVRSYLIDIYFHCLSTYFCTRLNTHPLIRVNSNEPCYFHVHEFFVLH